MKEKRVLIPLLRWVQKNPGSNVSRIKKDVQSIPWNDRMEGDNPGTDAIKWKLLYLEALGYVYEDSQGWHPSLELEKRLEELEKADQERRQIFLEGPKPTDDINCLMFTRRVSKRLHQQGIYSVSELRNKIQNGTLDKTGLGEKSLEEIEHMLDWHAKELAEQA